MEEKINNNFKDNTDLLKPKKKVNNWKIASFLLGIILIFSLIFGNGLSMSSISGNAVADDAIDFINVNLLQGQATATLDKVEKENGLWKATVSIMGQQTPVYLTNNGELMFLQAIPLKEEIPLYSDETENTQQQPVAEVSAKNDKPVVEAFIMSHCPYGTQIEKGLIPVAKALGDKIDFEIKFVYYAMHGDIEIYEQLNQYCIQKEQKDKYLDYLYCFLEEGDGESCLTTAGIDKEALEKCTQTADEEFQITAEFENKENWLSGNFPLFNIHKEENEKYGVRGSPTLVINGETINSGRDSASLLAAICSGFIDAPAECETEFEAASPAPGFGWDTTSANNAASAGCGV